MNYQELFFAEHWLEDRLSELTEDQKGLQRKARLEGYAEGKNESKANNPYREYSLNAMWHAGYNLGIRGTKKGWIRYYTEQIKKEPAYIPEIYEDLFPPEQEQSNSLHTSSTPPS